MKRALLMAGLLGLMSASAEKPKPALPDVNARVGVITRVFHPEARRNWRGAEKKELDATIWYPAIDTATDTKQYIGSPEPLFEAGSATPGAPFAPHLEKLPLIVLSHGSGGSALQMAWLGTALARAGYIAVAVDHPGNNSANGAQLTAEGFVLWWERATDVSNLIDGMLKDDEFGPRIDTSRIAAAGFSLGGYTVLELAGAQTDISILFDRCRLDSDAKPVGNAHLTNDAAVCRAPEMHGMPSTEEMLVAVRKTSGESIARSGESYRDPRLKAVFAIAPGLGFTQTPESLHAIRVPVGIVVGTEDKMASANENADYLRANLKDARETTLPGVSHYTFLDTCTPAGAKALPQYCGDTQGTDRDAVHAKVASMAITFFNRELKWR